MKSTQQQQNHRSYSFKTFQMFSQNHKSKIVFFLVTLLKDNCKTLKIAEKLVFVLFRRLWTFAAGVKWMM